MTKLACLVPGGRTQVYIITGTIGMALVGRIEGREETRLIQRESAVDKAAWSDIWTRFNLKAVLTWEDGSPARL
jgi:hypothetical protein